jgi:hypothetical protein
VDHADAGLRAERLHRQVHGAALAGRAVGDRVRLRLRQRDELGERVRRHVAADEEQHRLRAHQRDVREVAQRVVAGLLVGGRVARVRVRHADVPDQRVARVQQQRVAVGRGAAHRFAADAAAGAGAVVDDHRLAQRLRQFLGDDAAEHVGEAPGGPRHDDLDRLARVVGRSGRHGCEDGERAGDATDDRVQGAAFR